jgi:hypothetical protein
MYEGAITILGIVDAQDIFWIFYHCNDFTNFICEICQLNILPFLIKQMIQKISVPCKNPVLELYLLKSSLKENIEWVRRPLIWGWQLNNDTFSL